MSDFERIDKLREYVLSDNIAAGITDELRRNTVKDDFFTVFLSVCNKKERARVVHGSGTTLRQAWEDAEKNLKEFKKKAAKAKKQLRAAWVKADVVTSYKEIDSADFDEIVLQSRHKNHTRIGIALNPNFETAFLESELHGNKIIYYYTGSKRRELVAKQSPRIGCPLDIKNLNFYMKKYYGISGFLDESHPPAKITTFTTRGFFIGEDESVHELYSDDINCGRRKIDAVDAGVAKKAAVSAAEYLVKQIGQNGRTVYEYPPVFDKRIEKDCNVSVLRVLIALYHMNNDGGLVAKIDSVTGSLRALEKTDDAGMIIAYADYMDAFGNDKYVALMWEAANNLLKSEFQTNPKSAYALACAFTYTKDGQFLEAAKAAVDNFIARNYIRFCDRWVAYALFEITKHLPEPQYYDFALKNADKNLKAIRGFVTVWHNSFELLMTAWQTYQRALKNNIDSDCIRNYNPAYFAQTIYRRAGRMLNGFFYPEVAMYMKAPEKALGAFMMRQLDFLVRADDICSFVTGFLSYAGCYDDLKTIDVLDAIPNFAPARDSEHAIKISVIISHYNRMETVMDSLDSVAENDFPQDLYEVVVVDDGSTINIDSLRNYSKIKNYKFFQLGANSGGPSLPRNFGINRAVGEYALFIDSDDTISPGFMSKTFDIAKRGDCDVVICAKKVSRKSLAGYQKIKHDVIRIDRSENRELADFFFADNSVVGKLYRMELIKQFGARFPEKLRKREDGPFAKWLWAISNTAGVCATEQYCVNESTKYVHASASKFDEEDACEQISYIIRSICSIPNNLVPLTKKGRVINVRLKHDYVKDLLKSPQYANRLKEESGKYLIAVRSYLEKAGRDFVDAVMK